MKQRFSLISSALFLIAMTTAMGQIPRTTSFQGILADANGTLVPDGNHKLTMNLYAAASGGSSVYEETQTVAVVKGVFNVIIGSVTPLPVSLAFDRAYFLSVAVDGGSELLPRTALTTSPYAFHAAVADVANGLSPNASGVVTTVNGQTGVITLQGGGGTTISNNGGTITVSSVGGSGNGIQGVQNSDGTLSVQNANGPVATLGVSDNGISTAKLKDGAVTGTKLNTAGAQNGQVLTFDGQAAGWADPKGGGAGVNSVNSATGALSIVGGNGINVNTLASTITVSSSASGGVQNIGSNDATLSVTNPAGPSTDLSLADKAVTSAKLADGSVTPAKINTTGASAGQALIYNGTGAAWGAAGGSGLSLPYIGSFTNVGTVLDVTNTNGRVINAICGSPQIAVFSQAETNGVGVYGAIHKAGSTWSMFPNSGIGGYSPDGYGVSGVCDDGVAIYGVTSGSGKAGHFRVVSPAGTAPCVQAETNSLGPAGLFLGTNAASTEPVLQGLSSGTVPQSCGVFGRVGQSGIAVNLSRGVHGDNSDGVGVAGVSATNAGVFAVSNSGNGIHAVCSTGIAGLFEAGNASSTSETMHVTQTGGGSGSLFRIIPATNTNPVVDAQTSGSGDAVYGKSNSGRAAHFENTNASNGNTLVYAATNGSGLVFGGSNSGTGKAASFGISNTANTSDVLTLSTGGTGDCISVNHTGASGNLAVFQSGYASKARIDKTGKGFFNGGTQNSGADVAEAFDVEGARVDYEAGDVLVLSLGGGRRVAKSADAYSELVAGVLATKPGVLLTEHGIDEGLEAMVPMGIVGVIPTKVCGEGGAIRIGDLLATSTTPGCAMKADRARITPGCVIGKAMENFDGRGTIKINVLVNVK